MSLLKFESPEQVYKLNVTCTRTHNRVSDVLAFISINHLDKGQTVQLHNKQIEKLLGPRCSNVHKVLKNQLFHSFGHYQKGVKSYDYYVNKNFLNQLIEQFNHKEENVPKCRNFVLFVSYLNEQKAISLNEQIKNKKFILSETPCGRYYHPFNNLKRSHKEIYFPSIGLKYDYDMVCAAPTVLIEFAINQCGLSEETAKPILHYINNRSEIRKQISEETGLSIMHVKKFFTAIFYGAQLSTSEYSILFRSCDTFAQMDYFRKNEFIVELKLAISQMWKAMRKKTGLRLRNGSEKSRVYFKIERQITDVMINYCKEKGIFHLPEHDGIRTEISIDSVELEQVIKDETGFSVKLESGQTDKEAELTEGELKEIQEDKFISELHI